MRTVALVATAALAVLALSVGLLVWPFPLIRADTAAAQLEAFKVALAIGAGAAGLATVLLAARRQVHSEYTQSMVELDASERRITDLYTKPSTSWAPNVQPPGWERSTRCSGWPRAPRSSARRS
jgi:hypothetical protein